MTQLLDVDELCYRDDRKQNALKVFLIVYSREQNSYLLLEINLNRQRCVVFVYTAFF